MFIFERSVEIAFLYIYWKNEAIVDQIMFQLENNFTLLKYIYSTIC